MSLSLYDQFISPSMDESIIIIIFLILLRTNLNSTNVYML